MQKWMWNSCLVFITKEIHQNWTPWITTCGKIFAVNHRCRPKPKVSEIKEILQITVTRGTITQSNRLQHIQNSLARAVVTVPRSSDADRILKSLHWLRVPERIEYKIASTTYKLLQHSFPQYLRDLITIQPTRSTRSSSVVTVLHPQLQSSLKVTMQSLFPLLSTLSLEQTSSMT